MIDNDKGKHFDVMMFIYPFTGVLANNLTAKPMHRKNKK